MGTSLVVQWLRTHTPMQGMKVQSLVGEPRSHMPQGKSLHIATKTQHSQNSKLKNLSK